MSRGSFVGRPLVGRPLPLQAPTAFVRIRPHGLRLCGEGHRGRSPRCPPVITRRHG